ncbi:MAG TPA: hypothetical protein VGN72_03310 [Tepidisphaeraceae bacterium]|jgi:hypothetical protein|nr:hypothetical protein [Tepidisphaeraceae bacterium]
MQINRIRHACLMALLSAGAVLASGSVTLAEAQAPATDAAQAEQAANRPAQLTWAPPTLENPTTIDVAQVIKDRADAPRPAHLKLDKSKDYIIKMPSEPLTTTGGLSIGGGRNVVLIGGEIRFDEPPVVVPGEKEAALRRRAVYVNGATGTVHVEGLLITGEYAAEGFNIDMRDPNAVLQIQNVRVEKLLGTREGHHADVVQTWAGPAELRIDRLTGISQYQGFFLGPDQHFKDANVKVFDFRRMNVRAGGYVYWQLRPFPMKLEDVWAESENPDRQWPELVLWPKNSPVWEPVKRGAPTGGDFVPEGVAGINYVSPGYAPSVSEPTANVPTP